MNGRHTQRILRVFLLVCVVVLILVGTVHLTEYVSQNGTAQEIANRFGYIGIVAIAAVAGLNVVVPLPAATLTPVFVAAGLWLPLVVLMLVVGTTIADLVGYYVGKLSKDFVEATYPKTYQRLLKIHSKNRWLLLPFVFIYSAFIPLPNEAILIPIAMMGVSLRTFIVPLVAGTVVSQTALAFGAQEIFSILFGG